jgi:hypothetical protein
MNSTKLLRTRCFYIIISISSFVCTMMLGDISSKAQEHRMSENLPRSRNHQSTKINGLEIQSLISRQDIRLTKLGKEEIAPFVFRVINHSSEPQRIIPERFVPEWRRPRNKFQRVGFNSNHFRGLELADFPSIAPGQSINFAINIEVDWSEKFGYGMSFSRFFGAVGSVPIFPSDAYEVRFCYSNEENEHEQILRFYKRHGLERLDHFWEGTICTPTVKLFSE